MLNKTNVLSAEDFLAAIHGEDAEIHFRAIKKGLYPMNMKGSFAQLESKLEEVNETHDIYFTVNKGGTEQKDINELTALYVDFDAKDDIKAEKMAEGMTAEEAIEFFNQASQEYLESYKLTYIERLNAFHAQPTFILITGGGVHAYWKLKESDTVDAFRRAQKYLIQELNSDKAVFTEERVMRLPGFKWMKRPELNVMCTVNTHNDVAYTINEIVPESFVVVDEDTTNGYIRATAEVEVAQSNKHIDLIASLDARGLKKALKSGEKKTKYTSVTKAVHFFRQQDLRKFLGLPSKGRCFCPFHHNTNTPAASTKTYSDTKHQFFRCFSDQCLVAGDIVALVASIAKCDSDAAIKFLSSVYNVQVVEQYGLTNYLTQVEVNLNYVNDKANIEAAMPHVAKLVHRQSLELLRKMHEIAIKNALFTTDDGHVIFFTSLRHLCRELGKNEDNHGDLSRYTGMLSFIGAIKKHYNNDVPAEFMERALAVQEEKNQEKHIMFYSIPLYTLSHVRKMDKAASILIDSNFRITAASFEWFARNFGIEEARLHYPSLDTRNQVAYNTGVKFADEFDMRLKILIEVKGYATEKEVTEFMRGSKALKHIKSGRVLNDSLQKFGLQRVQSNKAIKEKYGITSNGYPKIIIPIAV